MKKGDILSWNGARTLVKVTKVRNKDFNYVYIYDSQHRLLGYHGNIKYKNVNFEYINLSTKWGRLLVSPVLLNEWRMHVE